MTKRLLALLLALSLLAAACGDDDNEADAAADDEMAEDEMAEDEMAEDEMAEDEMAEDAPAATIEADDQTGDGTTVTVASVFLHDGGFVVIHSDADGSPGPVIGHSELLAPGESTDVVVTLDTALDADSAVWPMAHVDANDNGEYEFAPPDVVIDSPATTADGGVAVLSINYTVG